MERSPRPAVEHAGGAIDVKLAGLVQLFQQVQRAEAAGGWVALADAVHRRRRQRDLLPRGVDRLDSDRFVVPVVAPVPLQPHARVHVPPRRGVPAVLEHAAPTGLIAVARDRSALHDACDRRPALVGPTRQLHALIIEEQLRRGGRAAEAVGERAQRHVAEHGQVRLNHLRPCPGGNPREHLLGRDGCERRRWKRRPAGDADGFTRRGLPRRSRILGPQFQRLAQHVRAAAQDDRDRRTLGADLAGAIARGAQRVNAIRRYFDRRGGGAGHEEQHGNDRPSHRNGAYRIEFAAANS
jgi:hypothetical protein